MVRFRFHRGSLDESMLTETVALTMTDLLRLLGDVYNDESHWPHGIPTRDRVRVRSYCSEPDNRIGWRQTWIVKVDGVPVGFTDGPVRNDVEVFTWLSVSTDRPSEWRGMFVDAPALTAVRRAWRRYRKSWRQLPGYVFGAPMTFETIERDPMGREQLLPFEVGKLYDHDDVVRLTCQG